MAGTRTGTGTGIDIRIAPKRATPPLPVQPVHPAHGRPAPLRWNDGLRRSRLAAGGGAPMYGASPGDRPP